MKLSLLSNRQEMKRVFLQLGNKTGLPIDLIIYLFQMIESIRKHDELLCRRFHTNFISFNIYEPFSSFGLEGMTFYTERDSYSSENPYSYRIPLDRNIEWIIKGEHIHTHYLIGNGMSNYLSHRETLLHQIEMIGTEDFLLEEDFSVRGRQYFESAPLRSRINFINCNDFDIVNSLYETYLDDDDDIENTFNVVIFEDGFHYTMIAPLHDPH